MTNLVISCLPGVLGKQGYINRLMTLVEERFGIHPSQQVQRKLERILDVLPDEALSEWVNQLIALPATDNEWLSLVESLTVHETYFFRDKPMMTMLREDILPSLINTKISQHSHHIRIWSAGCSTGEETYNIAMLILEILLAKGEAVWQTSGAVVTRPCWQIEILGTDVSRQVVRSAKEGIYANFGMDAFRDMTPDYWKYFEKHTNVNQGLVGVDYFQVHSSLKRFVSFRQHNLLAHLPPETNFDLVICRNVMIYFQLETKRQVQELFYRALDPNGVLILGGTDEQFWPERYERQFGRGGCWYVRK